MNRKMLTLLVLVLATLGVKHARAASPCVQWSDGDYQKDLEKDWRISLWENGSNSNSNGKTYSQKIPADVNDQKVVNEVIDHFHLNLDKASKGCKKNFLSGNKISASRILNNYVHDLYKMRGCGGFKERPSSDAQGSFATLANGSVWTEGSEYMRTAFAHTLFQSTNGSILLMPGGGPNSSGNLASALIKYKDENGNVQTKRVDVPTSQYGNFCRSEKGLERYLKMVKAELEGKASACTNFLLTSDAVIGNPPGTDQTFDSLKMEIDSKGQIKVNRKAATIANSPDGTTESYGVDRTHSIVFTRDPSGNILTMMATKGNSRYVTSLDRVSACHPGNETEFTQDKNGNPVTRLVYDYEACKKWFSVRTNLDQVSYGERSLLMSFFTNKNGYRTLASDEEKSFLDGASDLRDSSVKAQEFWAALFEKMEESCSKISEFIPETDYDANDAAAKKAMSAHQ